MQYSFAPLVFAAMASAAAIERACTFGITSSGGASGVVGQLTDGQVRIGPGLPITNSQFTISNGQITDSAGRGCILTPPTTQFQCDTGATPTGGFSIGSNGVIYHGSSSTFYACPATSNGVYNFYTTPVAGQTKCVAVTLTASGCYTASTSKAASTTTTKKATTPVPVVTVTKTSTGTVKASTTIKASTTTKAATTTKATTTTAKASTTTPATSTGKTCPANLSGSYQYPHLIIPVDSTKPTTAAGTSYNGQITSTVSSIFNFDIPASYTGTCSLVFLFPTQANLQTSSYTFSGPGTVDFSQLSSVATQGTTYANQPSVKTDFGVKTVTPGTSTVITTFACPAGTAVSYELKSVGGTSLTYFQDYNPSPIGLYITTC